MEALASDRSALRAALLSKPRNQAYVYITESLYRSLRADGPAFLGDLRGGGVTLTLHRRPPAQWYVCYVIYDEGYLTPDEFVDGYSSDDERLSVAQFPAQGV